MKKYRIIEIECFGGGKKYEAQKRLFGLLWWYNFLIDEDGDDAFFFTQKDAEEAIEYDMWKNKKRIVKTY
jgi:hypothetical protein